MREGQTIEPGQVVLEVVAELGEVLPERLVALLTGGRCRTDQLCVPADIATVLFSFFSVLNY